MGTPQGHGVDKGEEIYAPGALGRFLLGDYISASDKGYRSWAESKHGRVSTVDGSYRLCKSGPAE